MHSKVSRIALFAVSLLWVSSGATRAVTFSATGNLSNPAQGNTYHTGGSSQVGVPFGCTNMGVSVSGAPNGQMYNVQYTMDVELDSGAITGTSDNYNGLITCSPGGTWNHADTASQSPTPVVSTGSHTGTCYVDFYDVNNNNNKANNNAPTHNFTVVNP